MIYTQTGNSVTLEMSITQYEELLMMLGHACGGVGQHDKQTFWRWLRFVNELNATNPAFRPYAVPGDPAAAGGKA